MLKNIKIALLGYGNWGKNIARNLFDMGCLHSIYDVDKDVSEKVNNFYKLPNLSEDEIFDNIEVNALVIASNAETHNKLATKALLNEKDVLIEKPFCLSLSEARDLSKLAVVKKKILMVGHLLNYHNAFIKMRKLINVNAIGPLINIRAHRLALGSIRLGESVTYDLAAHDISMILAIMQDMPNEIDVQYIHHNKNIGPDAICVRLSFKNRVTALINCDWMCPYKEHRFSVIGKSGALIFNDTENWSNKLCYNPSTINSDNTINFVPLEKIKVKPNEPLRTELQEFINCIHTRKNPITDHLEAIKVQTVMEMIENKIRKN